MNEELICRLRDSRTLGDEELRRLLLTDDDVLLELLRTTASEVAVARHGNIVKARGLIEISNYCKNNCFYCGIRAGNSEVVRYRLTRDDIIACCEMGAELGFQTFVLQGGEDVRHTTEWVEGVVADIRRRWPDHAITLSLGERSDDDYQRWFDAGANRYLLRHETANSRLYGKLHPETMSFDNRIRCIRSLKRIGYETGVGMMVGVPYQTIDDIIADLRFMEELKPAMIGIGPFVPHHCTPFGQMPAGSVEMTLRLVSILRLMHPDANIPATTSLGTLLGNGREIGVRAGANVVMPNLSPLSVRSKYALYDGKIATDLEAAESRVRLERAFAEMGYKLV